MRPAEFIKSLEEGQWYGYEEQTFDAIPIGSIIQRWDRPNGLVKISRTEARNVNTDRVSTPDPADEFMVFGVGEEAIAKWRLYRRSWSRNPEKRKRSQRQLRGV